MPEKYSRRTTYVDAHQFEGWSDAIVIQQWIPGTLFVPLGYEHFLRLEGERDRSRGDVLENVAPYLVFTTPEKRHVRVDLRTWIVRNEADTLEFLTPDEFGDRFERADDVQ